MPHFRLIDGNAIGWRLHSAAETEVHPTLGIEVQGVRAFASQLSACSSDRDCLNIVLWDGRAQWRYDVHPGYKSGRHVTEHQREARRTFEAARPYMQRWAAVAPVVQWRHPLMEADDLAYCASRALAAAGYSVELFTVDSDWFQLVEQRVSWRGLGKGAKRRTLESFEPDGPLQASAHVKALSGDSSDSIDGLVGVGETRALQLLRSYGGLDALLRAAKSLGGLEGQPKWAAQLNLPESQHLVERNRRLVELSMAPAFDLSESSLTVGEYDLLAGLDLCGELGFEDWALTFPLAVRGLSGRLDEGRLRTFKRLAGLEG